MQPLQPLKPDDCHTINGVLDSCTQTADLIKKCKACNLPVEDYEAINEQQRAFAESVKREFFPHNA